MTKQTSRRAILAGAAAVLPASVAAALPVEGDHELRRLWAEYLARAADEEAAWAAMSPVRDAFDAELPDRLDVPAEDRAVYHFKVFEPLWIKHGLGPLNRDWNEASERVSETIASILAAKATTPFGYAVKLAALPLRGEAEDCTDAVRSVLADIDATLGGTTFMTAFIAAVGEPFEGIEIGEENEGVAS